MTTIKKVPSALFQGLGLHKGDFLTVVDESAHEVVIQITTLGDDTSSPQAKNTEKCLALSRFASGTGVLQLSTEQELDDARYAALKAKHLR